MKRLFFVILMIVGIALTLFASPRSSPDYPYDLGGKVYFINSSSYNLYLEIDIIDDTKGGFYCNKLSLEKKDIVFRHHSFLVYNRNQVNNFIRDNTVDPNNYFKKILIYDMDTGTLLIEINQGDTIFNLTNGSIENGDAFFEFLIDDKFLSGE